MFVAATFRLRHFRSGICRSGYRLWFVIPFRNHSIRIPLTFNFTPFSNFSLSLFQVEVLHRRITNETNESSSAGEFHPHALPEPDVNLSIHPALIVQPLAAFPFASGGTDWVLSKQLAPANRPLSVCDNVTFCTSALPIVSENVKVGRIPDKEQICSSCRSS